MVRTPGVVGTAQVGEGSAELWATRSPGHRRRAEGMRCGNQWGLTGMPLPGPRWTFGCKGARCGLAHTLRDTAPVQ